jgi:hypothetical protein
LGSTASLKEAVDLVTVQIVVIHDNLLSLALEHHRAACYTRFIMTQLLCRRETSVPVNVSGSDGLKARGSMGGADDRGCNAVNLSALYLSRLWLAWNSLPEHKYEYGW